MADELTEKDIGQISDALLAGRKFDAIKIYREATGSSLMEAKEFIEKLEDNLREEYPDKFPERGKGCAAVFLIGLVLATTGVLFLFKLNS